MFWNGLVYIINGLISALGNIFILIYNVLPNSLYVRLRMYLPSKMQYEGFLSYSSFFIQYGGIVSILWVWALFMLGYYAIRVVGKWVKML